MALYNAQGQALTAQQLRDIRNLIGQGGDRVQIFTDPDATETLSGPTYNDRLEQEITNLGGFYNPMSMYGDATGQFVVDAEGAARAAAGGLPVQTQANGQQTVSMQDPNFYNVFPKQDNSDIFDFGPLAAMGLLGAASFAPALLGSGAAAGGAGAAEGLGGLANAITGVGTGAANIGAGALGLGDIAAAGGLGAGLSGSASLGGAGGMSQAELASLIESGTAGTAGAGLEAAGLGGAGLTAGQVGGLAGGGALDLSGGIMPFGSTVADVVGTSSGAGSLASGLGNALTSNQGSTFGIPNNILSGLATGIGGLLGANASADAYRDVANQYLALGAPSRARLEASYAPGFDLLQAEPGLQGALDTAANTSARALSTKFGNPADSPAAQAEMNKYLMGNVYLPQLNTYRSQLLTGGGLGVNTAGTGSLAGAGQTGSGFEAIGAGLGQALNPQPSMADLFRQFGLGGQQQNPYKLNIGGLPTG